MEQEFAGTVIHIGVVVADLEKSMRFYKDSIGMVQVDKTSFDLDEDFTRRTGLTGGIPMHVEVLKLGSGNGATQFKLMSFGGRAQPLENDFVYNHTGMQYITVQFAELEPLLARLKENDIPLLGETPTPLKGGRYFVLVKDPDGTFIECIGPMKREEG
jgi:catechol 2,3-dioxygenase-like lactoylglutathione lyase family enzyme